MLMIHRITVTPKHANDGSTWHFAAFIPKIDVSKTIIIVIYKFITMIFVHMKRTLFLINPNWKSFKLTNIIFNNFQEFHDMFMNFLYETQKQLYNAWMLYLCLLIQYIFANETSIMNPLNVYLYANMIFISFVIQLCIKRSEEMKCDKGWRFDNIMHIHSSVSK